MLLCTADDFRHAAQNILNAMGEADKRGDTGEAMRLWAEYKPLRAEWVRLHGIEQRATHDRILATIKAWR